jgi:endonuclease YncB( thermonuclease family)
MRSLLVLMVVAALVSAARAVSGETVTYRIDHVTDGDTVVLRNGQRVRLVQIDTPEVYFGTECYGRAASRVTERLLPPGARVRLYAEPATDRIDDYGRLLRYVVRAKDGVDVNPCPGFSKVRLGSPPAPASAGLHLRRILVSKMLL